MAAQLTERTAPATSMAPLAGTFERAWRRAGFQIIHANILHAVALRVEGPEGTAHVAALPAWAAKATPAVRDGLLRELRDEWELAGHVDLVGALLYAVGLEVRATAAAAGQQPPAYRGQRRGAWGRWRAIRPW